MEAALRALLVGSGPVAALVGSRVYWGEIPQGSAAPAVVMYVVSRVPGYTFQGSDGMDESRIQIDVRDTNLGRAFEVRDAIRSILSGYRGTISGTYVSGAFLLMERQRRDHTGPGLFHTVSLDFRIWSRAAS
jgi:hypothetical protein